MLRAMFAAMLAFVLPLLAPQGATPMPEMATYQMVILRAGTARMPEGPAAEKMMLDHLAGLAELNRQHVNLLYGPMMDDGDIKGICVLDVPTADEARKALANDPHVKAGTMVTEVKPWMAPKGSFHAPASYDVSHHANLDPLIFGILQRGPNHSPNEAEAATLQKDHLAYMESLVKEGKLVAAGPFTDDGAWRGVVIYRVPSVDDAKALAAGDPAVKAGRLVLEAHPWMTLKGILQ